MWVLEMAVNFSKPFAPWFNPSKQAIDFANKSVGKLRPWLQSHYELAFESITEAPFDPSLFLYHLNGDYRMGTTQDNADNTGLGHRDGDPANRSLAYIASRAERIPLDMNQFLQRLGRGGLHTPEPYANNYGLNPQAGMPHNGERDALIFTREIAAGTSLQHFALPELATQIYQLSPYVKTFYDGVADYITSTMLDFTSGSNKTALGRTEHECVNVALRDTVKSRFRTIVMSEILAWESEFVTADRSRPWGVFNDTLSGINFHYPLYLFNQVYEDINRQGLARELRGGLTQLAVSMFQLAQNQNGKVSDNRGKVSGSLDRGVVLKAIKDSHFNALSGEFLNGTVIALNLKRPADKIPYPKGTVDLGSGRKQTYYQWLQENPNLNRFIIVDSLLRKQNNKWKRSYRIQLESRGAPLGEWNQAFNVPPGTGADFNFTIVNTDNAANSNYSSIENLIGKSVLQVSIALQHQLGFRKSQIDMRKLTRKDTPGHEEKLLRSINAFIDKDNRIVHKRGEQGIIDFYVSWRAEFLAIYLAGMYDHLKGVAKDNFVAFYEGDMFTNEFGYYASLITRHLSSRSVPEQPIDPIVGDRLVYKEPQKDGDGTMNRATYTIPVSRESVFYRLESPMMRHVYREYVGNFYRWYTDTARAFDRGERNVTFSGAVGEPEDPLDDYFGKKKKGSGKNPDRKTIPPGGNLLKDMWPLISSRATDVVQKGEVSADAMLRQLAQAAKGVRARDSLITPLFPFSSSFIDFGSLLSDPRRYAMPPSVSTENVAGFVSYLQNTFFTSYDMVSALATAIEQARIERMDQDALVADFTKRLQVFRNARILGKFRWLAHANLLSILRDIASLPASVRSELAVPNDTTEQPQRDTVNQVVAPTTEPVPEAIRMDP
jgi:hypothetical protein